MMFPVRCFSCGRVIAHKWDEYRNRVNAGENPKDVLESLGFKRYCCKRMFISAVNVMDEVLEFYTKYSEAGRSQI
ncbi:MAG: DNA-directed RNA polymerase subunit N [Candidatus Caldarchaeum sp.]|uniref:DNA-directed RNA polymerase subunit Rpo10 n=1 Tax=Caldiarchaeum subterraneum TaxID=311458 RepID=A0A7C5U6D2_CALS0